MYHFSPSTLGFYVDGVHIDMPSDVNPVTTARYDEIYAGLSIGKRLAADGNGQPVLLDAPGWTIDDHRQYAVGRTLRFANTIRERVSNSKHYLQSARWPIQLAAAQAIKAGTASEFDTSIMAREARLRGLGETVDQLADKVLANSLIFASVGAAVDGIERATLDAVAAYAGTDPAHFEVILADAKATALAEFLDIFGGVYGQAQAEAMAAAFFGPPQEV